MIYGKGVAAHDGDKRPEQYAQMMSLFKKQDLRRFINDYKVLGMAAFQLVYQNGKVKEVDAKGATIELADEVEAYLRASEIQRDRVEDATKHLTVGDDVEAKIISVDRKTRNINLSIKAKDEAEERQAIKDLGSTSTTAAPGSDAQPKTIGDLIKEQMQ